ncbi:hypothetical protein WA538_001806, partial [Blastocystis sp. DL]
MSSVYDVMKQSHRYETLRKQMQEMIASVNKEIHIAEDPLGIVSKNDFFLSLLEKLKQSIASLQTALSESEAAVDTTAGKKSCEIQNLLDSYSSLLHRIEVARSCSSYSSKYLLIHSVPYEHSIPQLPVTPREPFFVFSDADLSRSPAGS